MAAIGAPAFTDNRGSVVASPVIHKTRLRRRSSQSGSLPIACRFLPRTSGISDGKINFSRSADQYPRFAEVPKPCSAMSADACSQKTIRSRLSCLPDPLKAIRKELEDWTLRAVEPQNRR